MSYDTYVIWHSSGSPLYTGEVLKQDAAKWFAEAVFRGATVCPNPLSPPGNVIILVCRPVVATWGTSVDSSLLVSSTRPSPFASTSLMHAHTNRCKPYINSFLLSWCLKPYCDRVVVLHKVTLTLWLYCCR